VSAERIEAGLDKNGKVIAWRHRSVAPSIASTFAAKTVHEASFELGMGFVDMPFEIANIQCENPEAPAHTRIGWFRSVSNIPHAFAVQSMVAEIAHATNRDPKNMLLELIGSPRIVNLSSVKDLWNYGEPYDSYPIDTARLRKVVELVAEKGDWGRSVPKGHGLGIAVHRSFVSYITWSRCLLTRRASSRCPGSTRPLIAEHMSTPSASGLRSRALPSWPEPRQTWRDHLQGRQGATGEF
jgi:isoquinoline 1-oxidoreductase beta subunit